MECEYERKPTVTGALGAVLTNIKLIEVNRLTRCAQDPIQLMRV